MQAARSASPEGLLDGKAPAQTPGGKPQRQSVSLLDQNRAAELRFAADKGHRQVVLTVASDRGSLRLPAFV
jgi:hypothetical protein